MSYTTISNASKVLRSTLWNKFRDDPEFKSIIDNEAAIVFDSPAVIVPDGAARLSVWLYSVSINESFRNLMPPGDNPARSGQAPVQLNLHYLITPFGNSSEQEHLLLDGVIQFLYAHPVLEQLSSGEPTSGRADISIVSLTIAELTNLWAALRVPFRPSIACQVRLSTGIRV